MSLRRSVIGSLRGASPFSSSRDNNNDQSISNTRTPRTFSDADSFMSSSTRQTAAWFFKGSSVTSPTPESTLSRMSSMTIGRPNPHLHQEPFPKFAEFERDIDLVVTAQTGTIVGPWPDATFEPLQRVRCSKGDTAHPLFKLPASVRRRIYSFCFPYESRKISLSPSFATKAVFPEYYFASPWDIIDFVAGGLQATSMLRKELMTYFWTEYHFHVTVTEFSGPKFSPLSHVWLKGYLDIIQHITIEIDFTKFGGSQWKDAKLFGHNLVKTRRLVDDIVCGLGNRPAESSIEELHLMCRRYAGFRPSSDTWVEDHKDRYCPIDLLSLCDSFIHLRGVLLLCRLSGFPEGYSKELLNSIFGSGIMAPEYITPGIDAWPLLPSRRPTLAFSEPRTSAPPTPASLVSMEFGQLRLPHSRSFVEEMEDETSWYSTSPKSSNYALSPRIDTPIPATADGVKDAGFPLEEHVQKPQAVLLPEMVVSEPSIFGVPATPEPSTPTQPTPSPSSASTQVTNLITPAETESDKSPKPIIAVLPRTPAQKSRIPRAFTEPSPRTPNKMNELNEQDPAFIRTVNAMRSLEGTENSRRHTMIASPKTPKSAGSGATGKSIPMTKRKYMSFVNRLRGCADS